MPSKLHFIKRRKYILLSSVIVIIILSAYTSSVTDSRWKIDWDTRLVEGKNNLIQTKQISSKDSMPNVILIVCDDLGKYEVSAYGTEHLQTPNIDQLGTEGVIFEEGYVTSPICAPSRASILTGRIQNRFGFETQIVDYYPSNMVEYYGAKYLINMQSWELTSKPEYPSSKDHMKQGIPPSEINIAELLKSYGYKTGIIGKWHSGYSFDHLPLQRGFDYQYGFYGAFSLYTPEKEMEGIRNFEHDHFGIKHQWEKGRSEHGAIYEQGEKIVEEEYLTFAIRDRAVEFIEKNKESDHPFFLYVPFSAPHVPFQAPEEYYQRFSHIADENKRVYYAMITAVDDAIGDIHNSLKENGLEDNTLIVFISDNGGATYTEATENGPLKGGKTTQFEGGINIPFMMKWKGKINQGTTYSNPVISTDIFTTIAAAIGAQLPGDRVYDGENLIPFINNENLNPPHEELFWRADHIWVMRKGNYKLIMSSRDGWKELYDLKNDKSEVHNLLEEKPELFQNMYNKHLEWQKNNLPEHPLWPHLVDFKTMIDGKEYFFPS